MKIYYVPMFLYIKAEDREDAFRKAERLMRRVWKNELKDWEDWEIIEIEKIGEKGMKKFRVLVDLCVRAKNEEGAYRRIARLMRKSGKLTGFEGWALGEADEIDDIENL